MIFALFAMAIAYLLGVRPTYCVLIGLGIVFLDYFA